MDRTFQKTTHLQMVGTAVTKKELGNPHAPQKLEITTSTTGGFVFWGK